MAYGIFLKFHMKLEGLKDQKLAKLNFTGKFLFWGKSPQNSSKIRFLDFCQKCNLFSTVVSF